MDVMTEHPPLRRYATSAIVAAAAALLNRAQAGLLGQLDLAQEMLAFCFRDGKGGHWFLDATSGQWHQLGATDWAPVEHAPAVLEGLDGLPVEPPASPAENSSRRASNPPTSPIVALADGVDGIKDGYGEGRIDSQTAASLLAQRFLIDKSGRAWTVGVGSAKWYLYQDDGWEARGAPPLAETLARLLPPTDPCPGCGETLSLGGPCPNCGTVVPPHLDGVAEDAQVAVLAFLVRGAGSLPEPVTLPWEPPPGYPNVTLPAVQRKIPLKTRPETTPTPPPVAPRWRLQIEPGATVAQAEPLPKQVELGQRLRIGRETDNDLSIRSPQVSRHHAVIEPAGTGYTVVDLGSTNGTIVNGKSIAGPTPIQPGDTLVLYDTQLTVVGEGAPDRCPQCGTPVQPGRNFCTECGTALT
jgi:hypothetical protein